MIKKRTRFIKNKKGSSMVSVIVAFVLLLIGLSMFGTAMFVTLRITRTAQDIRNGTEKAMESYYTDPGGGSTSLFENKKIYFAPDEDSGTYGFYVEGTAKDFEYNYTDDAGDSQTFHLYTFER